MKYPYIKKQYSYIEGPELDYPIDNESTINNELGNDEFASIIFNFTQTIFNSRFYEFEFKKYYPSRFYDILYNELNDKHSPDNVIASLAILYSINYTSDNPLDLKSWLESFLKKPLIEDPIQKKSSNEQYLKIYETARIDIIKEGESQNKLEILENSDKLSKVRFPNQFNKNGSAGCLISSDKGELNLKIRCVGDGKLKIFLKTLGLKDKNNTTFPIYIDYFKLNVNDKEYLDENKLLCHDDRFHITLDVCDSEILNIYIKWLPYNESSVYTDKIKILKNRVMKLKDENAKIKKENKQLKMNAIDKC